jgi:uncharacterized protein (TIGR00369 family)
MNSLEEINQFCRDTLISHLDIEFTQVSANSLTARMPVNKNTQQPMGYLHGGATLALIETVGSGASLLYVDLKQYNIFGMSVSANHISSVRNGWVTATATIIHKGKSTHVWNVEVKDTMGKLISVARVTNAIVKKKPKE